MIGNASGRRVCRRVGAREVGLGWTEVDGQTGVELRLGAGRREWLESSGRVALDWLAWVRRRSRGGRNARP